MSQPQNSIYYFRIILRCTKSFSGFPTFFFDWNRFFLAIFKTCLGSGALLTWFYFFHQFFQLFVFSLLSFVLRIIRIWAMALRSLPKHKEAVFPEFFCRNLWSDEKFDQGMKWIPMSIHEFGNLSTWSNSKPFPVCRLFCQWFLLSHTIPQN